VQWVEGECRDAYQRFRRDRTIFRGRNVNFRGGSIHIQDATILYQPSFLQTLFRQTQDLNPSEPAESGSSPNCLSLQGCCSTFWITTQNVHTIDCHLGQCYIPSISRTLRASSAYRFPCVFHPPPFRILCPAARLALLELLSRTLWIPALPCRRNQIHLRSRLPPRSHQDTIRQIPHVILWFVDGTIIYIPILGTC
jgi:hypothetical protein